MEKTDKRGVTTRSHKAQGDMEGDAGVTLKGDVSGDMMDYIADSSVGVSLMSGSTSTPTPLVKKRSHKGEPGTVHKKDAVVPDDDVQGTHPR